MDDTERAALPAELAVETENVCRHRPRWYSRVVSEKSMRQAARADVVAYHNAQLTALVARVAEAIDRHRAGELDPFEVDHVLYQYSRSAKELWKFCNLTPVEIAATIIRTEPPTDWWERGAPRSD